MMDLWLEAACWLGAFFALPVIIGLYYRYMRWVYDFVLDHEEDEDE